MTEPLTKSNMDYLDRLGRGMKTHCGDPCIHCGSAHDDVAVGECAGNQDKAKVIAYRSLGVRWDNVEHFLLKWSDGRITSRHEHISFNLSYRGFNPLGDIQHPPTYDENLRMP